MVHFTYTHTHTKMGYWGILDYESDDNLFLYPCPSGYCRCELRDMGGNTQCIDTFNSESGSDNQCSCDRRGSMKSRAH